jgi:hypothetical protein
VAGDQTRRRFGRATAARFDVRAVFGGSSRTVNVTTVQLEVTLLPTAAAAPAATFVRVGLWDNAFDTTTGSLLNGATDATHFIGRDSRKFHFRVRDPVAAGEVVLDWRTRFGNGVDDDVPASQRLSLLETSVGSHVFASRAVMLVTDDDDRDQSTNSGLPASHADTGTRARGSSNHRLRKITVDGTHALDSELFAAYTPAGALAPVATVRLPVFQRTPEDRRRVRVRLVNVRATAGTAGSGILTPARRDSVMGVIRSIYARCGIFAEVTEAELDPPASCVGWATRFPGDPSAIDPSVEGVTVAPTGNLIPSGSMDDLTAAVRALPGFDANDLHLVYVAFIFDVPLPAPPAGLQAGTGGQAFADDWTTAASGARSFAFVGLRSGITLLADPHEATHITTNLSGSIAGGHFDLEPGGAVVPGNIDGKNLMNRHFLAAGGASAEPKRLWDRAFTNASQGFTIPAQVTEIRRRRFTRPF